MIVQAKRTGSTTDVFNQGRVYVLSVRSNPLGFFHFGNSLRLAGGFETYKTVTDFMETWQVLSSNRHTVCLPFLKDEHGLGDVVAFFAEKFPLWIKQFFRGCTDRQAWLNWNLAFVPAK